jgi:hypothetical protein
MNRKKNYLIQPTYKGPLGKLHQGKRLIYASLALPALSAAVPSDWQKECCVEYFAGVDYGTDAAIIGISSMGYDILHGSEIAAEFKKRGKTVIFGGTQAHFSAKRLAGICDSIVHGNPDPQKMKEILDDASNGTLKPEYVCGLSTNFPFDYSVLADKPLRLIPVLTSVGCKEDCDFCCTAAVCSGRYRLRKLDVVVADIKSARDIGRNIVFADSNIFNNRDYLERLCARILDERLIIRWAAQCTADVGDAPELLQLLKRSGCFALLVGIETLDQRNMDSVHKRVNVSLHRQRVRSIRDAGIVVGGYFILGMDFDSAETFDELFRFIRHSRIALPILNILLPAFGTRIFHRLDGEGRMLVRSDDEFLKNTSRYAAPSSHCFYLPRRMTAPETEREFLKLYGRLTSWREIIRRSIQPDLFTTVMLFKMNVGMRGEYRSMVKEMYGGGPESAKEPPAEGNRGKAA